MVQEINNMEINQLVNQIVHGFPAKEIFLFGSFAYGNPQDESDIDLCIITDRETRKLDLHISVKLDTDSGLNWTVIPDQTGQIGAKRRTRKLAYGISIIGW